MKLILHVLLAFGFMACTVAFAQTNDAMGKTAQSYNAFGLKLLAEARRAVPDKNVFISPIGLGIALSMAAEGANGDTLQQMLRALQLDATPPDLTGANKALLDHLSQLNSKVKLEIANSLWTAKDAAIKPAYETLLQQSYQAKATSVDFKDPAAAQEINRWVNDHTHGKIPTMVAPPLDQNRLILLDAIYFKGDWLAPFDKKLTRDLPFTLANGQAVTHPRMSRTGEFDYFEDDALQAVRLPYAGRAVSMYVFLPKKNLDDLVQNLNMDNWLRWTTRLRSRKGTVELPRFKLENEYKLNGELAALGMPQAFTRQANFHGISDESLYIGWVKQKTYVDVNEEGTEAAAVTGVGMRASVVHREEPPFQMIVDRPFFLVIHERESGAMLFVGAINDPRS